MPPVLLGRGGPDDLHLAPAQRGLEDVRRVDRALGAARPDDGVQLVDEEDHVPRPLYVAQHGLDPVLEIAAVLGPGEQGRDVERDDALAPQLLGRAPPGHEHRQTLGHGGLADARLAHQDGVVLAAPREDLDGAADLRLPPDDGVDRPRGRQLRQIPAVLVEDARLAVADRRAQRARLGAAAGIGIAEHGEDLGIDAVGVGPGRRQHPHRAAVGVAQDAEQQMLGADAGAAQRGGLAARPLQNGARGGRQALDRDPGAAHPLLAGDQAAQLLPLQPLRAQDVRAETVALGQDAEQQMLGPDAAVPQLSCAGACALDGELRPLCKFLVAFDRSTLPLPLSAASAAETDESGRRVEYRQKPSKIITFHRFVIDF